MGDTPDKYDTEDNSCEGNLCCYIQYIQLEQNVYRKLAWGQLQMCPLTELS